MEDGFELFGRALCNIQQTNLQNLFQGKRPSWIAPKERALLCVQEVKARPANVTGFFDAGGRIYVFWLNTF